MASPFAFGSATRSELLEALGTQTVDNWCSQKVFPCCGGFEVPPHLESGGAKLAHCTLCLDDGLAMQEVSDPAFRLQRALLQVRATLEQGMDESDTETTGKIQKQLSGQSPSESSRGRERACSVCWKDSLGSHNAQLPSQPGHYTASARRSCSYGLGEAGHATRACPTLTTGSGRRKQDARTPPGIEAGFTWASSRTRSETPGARSEAAVPGDQTQSWTAQQDGQGATTDFHPVREDCQAGPRLADVCEAGRGTLSETQRPTIFVDTHGPSTSSQGEGRRARTNQGRDFQSVADTPQFDNDFPMRGHRGGRHDLDGIITAGRSPSGGTRRLSRSRRIRYGNGSRILLVEIAPGEATPPGYCAVLMMTCSQHSGLMGRAYPKLVREETSADVLVAQHTYSQYCIPTGLRVCHLAVEGASKTPHEPVNVRPGALSKLTLGDATPSFEDVHVWHPHAEELALAALALHRTGLESFQMVLHAAGQSPRELTVDLSAFTAPQSLRKLLPLDVVRGRLLWLPMNMLHPTIGVRPGRFHFVVGAQRPGLERPILVLSCRAASAYHEQWHHEVRWIAHGTSMADFIAVIFPEVAVEDLSSVSVSSNQVPITTIHDVGAGDSVVAYLGRSMSSEGLPAVAEDDDGSSLMQLSTQGDMDPSTFTAHVVLQHLLPIWRGRGPARDVFQRRTLHLLNQRFTAHQLFSWSRIASPLWNGEYSEVDLLIQYPRPLGSVDIVVEFVDMVLRQRLEEPVIFRVLVPLTS